MDARWARVGEEVRAGRAAQNLTQDDLATLVGVSVSTIAAIERGQTFTKVTPTLRAVERILGWGHGSIEAVCDGGKPLPSDSSTAQQPQPAPTGLPWRVAQTLAEGTTLETRVVPIGPKADMVVIIQGRPDATPEQLRAELLAWEKREGALERLREVADDPPENG